MRKSPDLLPATAGRTLAEEELRRAHDKPEPRVQEGTSELAITNASLLAEIAERKRVETALVEAERSAKEKSTLRHPDLSGREGRGRGKAMNRIEGFEALG